MNIGATGSQAFQAAKINDATIDYNETVSITDAMRKEFSSLPDAASVNSKLSEMQELINNSDFSDYSQNGALRHLQGLMNSAGGNTVNGYGYSLRDDLLTAAGDAAHGRLTEIQSQAIREKIGAVDSFQP